MASWLLEAQMTDIRTRLFTNRGARVTYTATPKACWYWSEAAPQIPGTGFPCYCTGMASFEKINEHVYFAKRYELTKCFV